MKLPYGYRTVFNMYVIEGYSHKEIGEKLKIEESSSRSQLAKAKVFKKNFKGQRFYLMDKLEKVYKEKYMTFRVK